MTSRPGGPQAKQQVPISKSRRAGRAAPFRCPSPTGHDSAGVRGQRAPPPPARHWQPRVKDFPLERGRWNMAVTHLALLPCVTDLHGNGTCRLSLRGRQRPHVTGTLRIRRDRGRAQMCSRGELGPSCLPAACGDALEQEGTGEPRKALERESGLPRAGWQRGAQDAVPGSPLHHQPSPCSHTRVQAVARAA